MTDWEEVHSMGHAEPVRRIYRGPAPTGAPELDRMVEYVRACWAEERCLAEGVTAGGETWKLGNSPDWRLWIEDDRGRQVATLPARIGEGDLLVGEHIERQDPQSVLADLDTKEQLLGFLRPTREYGPAVRILLQRYAKRKDFPPAWVLPSSEEATR